MTRMRGDGLSAPAMRGLVFLDTAPTLQVVRGAVLWLALLASAWPAALVCGLPQLAWLLAVAGFPLLRHGPEPTRVDMATRPLRLGRLLSRVVGIGVMVGLARATHTLLGLAARAELRTLFRGSMG